MLRHSVVYSTIMKHSSPISRLHCIHFIVCGLCFRSSIGCGAAVGPLPLVCASWRSRPNGSQAVESKANPGTGGNPVSRVDRVPACCN